jgi:L-asparaginase
MVGRMPLVAVGSLGGTITMTAPDADGDGAGAPVTPTAGADDLVSAVPGLARVADLRTRTLQRVPGASLTASTLLDCLEWARRQVDEGAAGVVLVQGTDTLEESAYLLDLFWERPEPLVLTGAMRNPEQAGADGPANLLAAVTVAASAQARDVGALVVMNDEVHAAARVRKVDAAATHAFASPVWGPVARVVEGAVSPTATVSRPVPLPVPRELDGVRVALVEASLDDEGSLVSLAVSDGYDGIVVAGFGVGHVSQRTAEVLSEAVRRIPVVVSTRTGAGTTLTRTYGFAGSESDLLRRGAVLAGWLDPRKSRLLLWSLLALGYGNERVRQEFRRRGQP